MESNNDLLDMMAAYEEKVSELYQALSVALPEWQEFWMTISHEEQLHASWLRGLKNRLALGGGTLSRERFNVAGIRTSMDYLQKLREDVLKKGITPLRALVLSLDIESALLEKEYYTVYKSDLASVQETFNNLREQTREHSQRMQTKFNEERAKQNKA
jgi:hypothetical protein